MPEQIPDQLFLDNVYSEIKDLGKQFLTLVSAVLAFTVTFAEKVVDFGKAFPFQKYLLLFAWFLFIVSIAVVGIGLWWNYNASMHAVQGDSQGAWKRTRKVYSLFLFGGFSFVLGLSFLVLAAASRM